MVRRSLGRPLAVLAVILPVSGLLEFARHGQDETPNASNLDRESSRSDRSRSSQRKRKPTSALDELIFAIYGNPPPPKSARPDEAAKIAHGELLLGLVSQREVAAVTKELNESPIPYSTHDLALSVAQNFFRRPELIPHMFNGQLSARLKAAEWLQQGKVAPLLVESFEDVLYKTYRPTFTGMETKEQNPERSAASTAANPAHIREKPPTSQNFTQSYRCVACNEPFDAGAHGLQKCAHCGQTNNLL